MASKNSIKTADIKDDMYGTNDVMLHGFSHVKADLDVEHPLELSERQFVRNEDEINKNLLRRTQGLHAPIRITMEERAASKIQRLACLASSNSMVDVIRDKLDTIGPKDIFNNAADAEMMGYPQLMVENQLGILK